MKQDKTQQGRKSEHILHTQKDAALPADKGRFATKSKTSAAYWLGRVFKHKRSNRAGKVVEDPDYSCQLSSCGRRERFQMHTSNNNEAAKRSAAIFRDVTGKGWDEAVKIHNRKLPLRLLRLVK